jgi:hypothetical protein
MACILVGMMQEREKLMLQNRKVRIAGVLSLRLRRHRI